MMVAKIPDTATLWIATSPNQSNTAVKAGDQEADAIDWPHGTYPVAKYYRLRSHTASNDANTKVLTIFGDTGAFARFRWDETKGYWTWEPTSAEFHISAGTYAFNTALKQIVANTVTRRPTLTLATYTVPSSQGSHPDVIHYYVDTVATPRSDQLIVYEEVTDSFTWRFEGETKGISFIKAEAQTRVPKAESADDSFGYVFNHGIGQVALPYFGFDPRNLLVYSSDSSFQYLGPPRTEAVDYPDTNPGQEFFGPLVFEFPTKESGDFTNPQNADDSSIRLPLGLGLVSKNVGSDKSHAATIGSVDDTMSSWSASLGLSGGIKGMMSAGVDVAYSSRIEDQKKRECRYNVSRKLDVAWVASLHAPDLLLHQQFIDNIKSLTAAMLSESPRFDPKSGGEDPLDWENFVARFGTHYCHAMTQGSMSFSETRFSLVAETKAFEKSLDLSCDVSADIEGGGSSGLKSTIKNSWSSKHLDEVSTEDITTFRVGVDSNGAKTPVAIFYDLRPLTELLSPIFLSFNPADDWGNFAPFVWYDLRERFETYLETLGLNKPIGPELSVDYTPRKIQVSVPDMTLDTNYPDPSFLGQFGSGIFFNVQNGMMTLGAAQDQGSQDDEESFLLAPIQGQTADFSDYAVPQGGSLLDGKPVPMCYLAAKHGATSVGVSISGSLDIYESGGTRTQFPNGNATIDLTREVSLSLDQLVPVVYTKDGFTVTLHLMATDKGPLARF